MRYSLSYANGRDVTERVQAKELLQAEHERMEAAIWGSNDGIWPRGRFTCLRVGKNSWDIWILSWTAIRNCFPDCYTRMTVNESDRR